MADDTSTPQDQDQGGGTATVDWQHDPEFHALPLAEKHKVLLSVDPDYKALPGSEQVKALSAIHYNKGGEGTGKQFTDERKPENQEGFGMHTLTTIGRQAGNLAKSTVAPYTAAYGAYNKARDAGSDILPAVGKGAVAGLTEAIPGATAYRGAQDMMHAPKDYKERRDEGYSPAYSAAAPAAASATNVDLPSMEHQADIGNTKGVLAEAAVPMAEAAGGYAAHEVMGPEGPGGKALETRRQTKGPQNIIDALDTPAGKGGKKAAAMADNVDRAKGDLAEIQRTNPVKGKGAQAHHDLAEAIEDRQDTLWEQGHAPGIERHAQTPIDHQKLVSAAKTVVSDEARDAAPGEADAVDKWIEKSLDKERTLQSTDKFIREINDDLKGKDADTRYGPLQVRARQAVVAAARQEVEDKLIAAGEQGVKNVNGRYGALGAIKDRLREKAVQLARSENKDGVMPSWVKTYGFLHPTTGLVAGVGLDLAKMVGKPSNLRSGMRQLGRTSLDAPIHDIPPPGWRTPGPATWGGQPPSVSGKLLPAPTPPVTELPNGPDTSGSVNDPEARWSNPKGLLKAPVRGLLPAPRVEGNAPGTAQVSNPGQFPPEVQGLPAASNVQRGASGRMSRVSLGTPEPGVIGHTAEGGDMYSPAEPAPQRAERPTERREEMNQTRVSPTGEERRDNPPAESDPHSASRTAIVKVLNEVMDDTQATAAQKAKAKTELADIQKGAKTRAQKGAREKGLKGGKDFDTEDDLDWHGITKEEKEAAKPFNRATFKGKPFWSGSVDLTDGSINETHRYELAENRGFHHNMYFTPEEAARQKEGESSFFFVDKDGSIANGEGEKLPKKIEDKIREQIKIGGDEEKSTERRAGPKRDFAGPDYMRTTRFQQLREQLKDPSLSDRDRGILEAQVQDMKDHPFEQNELGSDLNAFKKEKKMSKEEAEANTEKRKEGRNQRFGEEKPLKENEKKMWRITGWDPKTEEETEVGMVQAHTRKEALHKSVAFKKGHLVLDAEEHNPKKGTN